MMKRFIVFLSCVAFLFLAVSQTNANPVTVTLTLEDGQDVNWIEDPVDELGFNPPFPENEWITSSWVETIYRPCLENPDDPGIPNAEVSITNMTPFFFSGLQYVADPETSLQNYDEYRINGQAAFLIDDLYDNTPLISESMVADLIFAPGETWVFVIQDYQNSLGLAPSLFGSLGVPTAGDSLSSGSIILPIPEPASLLILGLGSIAFLRRKR